MTDIGAKISIDGEKQFRQELQNITQTGKTLSAQMDALTASFDKAERSEEDNAKVSKKLNEQIENQQKLVDKLKEAVARSAEKTGENSTETQKWKEKLAKAETGLAKLKNQANDAGKEVEDFSNEEKEASNQTSIFGDVLKANLASEAIKKGVQMLASAVKEVAKFFADAVKDAAEYADTVNTLAKTTGMGTDAIQEYQYAAKLLDVEFSTIQGSLTKLTSKMSSAKDGNKAATEAFEKLGVKITNANGSLRDANDVFDDAIAALGNIQNDTERDAAAMDIFGKSAKELNPLIEAGADALASYREEAHRVGAVMDKDTLDSMNELQDSLDRVSGTWDALKRTLGTKIGIKILPEIEKLTQAFQKLVETGNVSQFIDTLTRGLTKERNWTEIGKKVGDLLGRILGSAPKIIVAGVKMAGGLIKGLISGVPDMVNAIGDELRKSKLSDATRDIIYDLENVRNALDDIQSASDRTASSLGEVNGKQKEAEHWIEIFDELSKVTDPTAQETERLETAVRRLNELYPELALKLDTDTGKWSLNTEEIRRNIDALSDKYRAEAYYAAAGETLTDIAKLEAESQVYRDQLATITAQKDATDRLVESKEAQIQKIYALREEYARGQITLTDYYNSLSEMSETAIDGYQAEEAYIKETKESLHEIYDQQLNINARYEEAVETVEAYDNKINDLNKDVEFLWSKAGEYSDKAAEKAGSSIEQVEKIIDKRKDAAFKRAQLIGKAIDDGTAAGIDQNAYKITSAAEKAVQGAINAMRRTAEIRSPSKVTRDLIGKNLALGVVEGWEDVFSPDRMRNAFSLRGAIGEMSGSVSNVTNNANFGGVSVNVYARDGESADALADRIMLKIQAETDKRRAVFA